MMLTILRLPAVLKKRGRSRSAHYRDIQMGLYTRPVAIGPRAVGWPDDEVARLNAARIAGLSDKDIRVLVQKLEASRTTAGGSSNTTKFLWVDTSGLPEGTTPLDILKRGVPDENGIFPEKPLTERELIEFIDTKLHHASLKKIHPGKTEKSV